MTRTRKIESVDSISSKLELKPKPNFGGTFYIKYFDFWWFLGICPFRLRICQRTKTCNIQRNTFQSIFFGLNFVLCLWEVSRWFFDIESSNNVQINYFYRAELLGYIFIFFCYIFAMLRRSNEFKDLTKFLIFSNNEVFQLKWSQNIRFLLYFCIYALLNQLCNLLYVTLTYKDYSLTNNISAKVISWLAERLSEILDIPTTRFLSVLFRVILNVPSYSFKAAWETLLTIEAMAVHVYVNEIEIKLQQLTLNTGYDEYIKLRSLFQMSNRALEIPMFGFIFGVIPMLLHSLPEIIQPKSIVTFFERIISCCVQSIYLIYISWLTKKTNRLFRKWLLQESSNVIMQSISDLRLKSLLHQFSKEGLLGFEAFGFIKFSSGSLSGISILVFTLSVVYIQFKIHPT